MTEQDKSNYQGPERRRSERLYLTVPIRVTATDPKGRDFTEDCLSVNVSRNGARIRLKNALTVDDVIRIKNLRNGKETTFRVVGRVGEPQPDRAYADWGVDILDPTVEIWDVELKENPLEQTAFSALMECRTCHVVSSFLLTYKELGAAGASSFITRSCPRCGRETLWSYVRTDRRENPISAAGHPVATEAHHGTAPAERQASEERRQAQRLALQVPIRVRTPEGEEEISTTLDLSRRGAHFLGSREYARGATLFITAPYRPGEHPLEVKACVEQIEELPGSAKKIYALRFEFKEE